MESAARKNPSEKFVCVCISDRGNNGQNGRILWPAVACVASSNNNNKEENLQQQIQRQQQVGKEALLLKSSKMLLKILNAFKNATHKISQRVRREKRMGRERGRGCHGSQWGCPGFHCKLVASAAIYTRTAVIASEDYQLKHKSS